MTAPRTSTATRTSRRSRSATSRNIEDVASGQKYAEAATRTDARTDHRPQQAGRRARRQAQGPRVATRAAAGGARPARQREDRARPRSPHDSRRCSTRPARFPVMGDAELTRRRRQRLVQRSRREVPAVREHVDEGPRRRCTSRKAPPSTSAPSSRLRSRSSRPGSFGHALDNNYGGIGACDSCDGEIVFPTPRDGVRGQIQLLKTFADPSSRASGARQPAVAPDLRT